MPELPAQKPLSPKPRRSWWRRLLRGALVLLLLLAVFHRPILLTAARLVLIKIAARQNVTLNVHFSGTIFTNLTVRDVNAVPNGKGTTPVEKISIEQVHLEYSIPNLIRHGIGEFLHTFEIHNADLVFSGLPSSNKQETEQKKSLAEDLNSLLGQPALYADLVRIENFNVTVHSPQDTIEVKGVNLFLHPWEPGYFRIARISVPGLPPWENLEAKTSYAQRNLYLEGLRLSPDLAVDEFNFDASQRAQNKGSMLLKVSAFGGKLALAVAGSQLNRKGENLENSYDTTLNLDASGIDLQAGAAYFKAPAPPVARLAWLKTVFAGEPERPRTWKGEAGLRVEAIALGTAQVDFAELDTVFSDGTAKVTSLEAASGPADLDLTAQTQLPESVNDFAKSEADAAFTLTAGSLDELTKPYLPEALTGSVTGGGKLGLHRQRLTADVEIKADQLANTDLGLGGAAVTLHATKALDLPANAGPLEGLESQLIAELHDLRYTGFTTDSAVLQAETHNDRVDLQKFEVVRAENSVSAKGTYRLPKTGEPMTSAPLQGEFSIQAPSLGSFALGKDGHILEGHLSGGGKVQMVGNAYQGDVLLQGGDFVYGGFQAAKFNAQIGVQDNEASIEQLQLQINGTDQISLTGKAGMQAPFAYEGAVLVLFKDLAVLQPLLETFGVKDAVGGALDFSVESQGKIQPLEPSGHVKLALEKPQYGTTALSEVKVEGLFGPKYAETTVLRVAMKETTFQGGLEWRDDRLRLKDIDLHQGAQQALSGFVLLPFEPQNPQGMVPFDKRVAVNINADKLDIEKLLASLGQTVPAAGLLSMNLVIGGTIWEPAAHLKIAGRNLHSKSAAQLKPAEIDLNAHYSGKELDLDAAAREPDIQPLTIQGHVPLDLHAVLEAKKLDPDLPIDLAVKLPPSSLAFLSALVPSVRSIAGTAAIDAHVNGTVDQPKWGGSVSVKLDYARLKNEAVPGIGKLDIGLAFSQDALNVQRFRGEIGGGSFELGGKVGLTTLTQPTFDLRLKSNSVLVKRDDSITVRMDSDIQVAGAMAAGKVAGTVWITQSRFFRDIDILPIALPGRPKPKPEPRSAPSEASFALGPPLSNWTFDIAVKTRPNDPFKIQGNLANGAASVDLKFGGTGAKPWLEGTVRVDRLAASLPFSKLEVQRGFITFTKDAFLQPKLEIFAESELRDYHINAYIFGSATDPQLSLTSEPPLPQQDLISLIATGTTTSELTGSGDVLASRAAILLFQGLYHKVFKSKKPPSEDASAHDRFSFDAGAVDSKTGRQEIAASFRLTDKTYLVGDVDVTGQFSGRLKYLLRFR